MSKELPEELKKRCQIRPFDEEYLSKIPKALKASALKKTRVRRGIEEIQEERRMRDYFSL